MQCLDDQSAYSLLSHLPNSSSSTQPEWKSRTAETEVEEVENKVADRSNSQQHFANCKAMSQRGVTLRQTRQHCPRFSSSAANNLFTVALVLLLAAAFVKSVALHPSTQLHPESVDNASSPLQPVLALNSSVAAHGSINDLHCLLAPLTDEHDEEEEKDDNLKSTSQRSAHTTDSQSKVPQNGINRRKRDVASDDESNTTKMPKNKNKRCYKKVLFHCGRTFVHSYKFVRVKNNNDNDILVAQCALRMAFFDCLKSRANDCNKKKANEMNGKVKRNGKKLPRNVDGLNVPSIEKNTPIAVEKFEKHLRSMRKRLAETIWDSRICIFKNSLKVTPLPV